MYAQIDDIYQLLVYTTRSLASFALFAVTYRESFIAYNSH